VTFTQLGNGSDHTIQILGVTGLRKGLETGKAWKTVITAKVSAAAGVPLEDMITVTRPS
jgi:hypothetical protein